MKKIPETADKLCEHAHVLHSKGTTGVANQRSSAILQSPFKRHAFPRIQGCNGEHQRTSRPERKKKKAWSRQTTKKQFQKRIIIANRTTRTRTSTKKPKTLHNIVGIPLELDIDEARHMMKLGLPRHCRTTTHANCSGHEANEDYTATKVFSTSIWGK